MNSSSRRFICATGGKSDVGFFETIAKATPNDEIFVVRVMSEGDRTPDVYEKFEKMSEICRSRDRKCSFRILDTRFGDAQAKMGISTRNDVGQALCLAAQSVQAHELIIGYKSNLSRFNRTLLGSVSQYCVSNCLTPVTVVKANCLTSGSGDDGVCRPL